MKKPVRKKKKAESAHRSALPFTAVPDDSPSPLQASAGLRDDSPSTRPTDLLQNAIERAFPVIGSPNMVTDAVFARIQNTVVAQNFARSGNTLLLIAAGHLACALAPKFDYEKTSLQHRLVSYGGPDAASQFETACSDRDFALFRIAQSMLSGSAAVRSLRAGTADMKRLRVANELAGEAQTCPVSLTLDPMRHREEALLSLCSVFPERILSLESFIQIVVLRLRAGKGLALLDKLGRNLAKSRRRTREGSFNVDPILIAIAQHWTNPDYPLWLMREPAATKALDVVFGANGVSTNQFIDRRQDHFSLSEDFPILDATVRRQGGTKIFAGFKFRTDVQHLSGVTPSDI